MQIMLFRLEISSGEDGCRCLAVCGEGAWHFRNDGASLESFLGSGVLECCRGVLLLKFPEVASVDCSLLTAEC